MSPFKSRDIVNVLEDLLVKERNAILSGNFTLLNRILTEKKRVNLSVSSEISINKLTKLLGMADRNQALLHAAGQGIKAVSKRLAHLQSAGETLQTYTRSGQRIEHNPSGSRHVRRA